jgi:hypothetical protein
MSETFQSALQPVLSILTDYKRIRILLRLRIQGFDDNIFKNFTAEKKSYFDQKMQFIYPQASMKNVQTTGEAFSPHKRTSGTSKHNFFTFLYFCPPGSELDPANQN